MIHRPRLGALIAGLLSTACLAGGVYATLRFNIGGIRYLPPRASTLNSLESSTASPFTSHRDSRVTGADSSSPARARGIARHPARQEGPRNIVAPEKAGSGTSTISPGPNADVDASPAPDRKTLKPIGYVQKANGLVEAIVSEGDGIQVVHVGDVFEEKFTVAQISPEAVEIVASSASTNILPSTSTVASNSTRVILPGTGASASSGKPIQGQAALRLQKRLADSNARTGLGIKSPARINDPERQASVHQVDSRQMALPTPTLDLPKPIGYVELQAGTRIAVVPDGEFVRLVQPEVALADQGGITKESKPVEIASAPKLIVPKHARTNYNRVNDQAVLPPVALSPLGYVEKAEGKVQAIIDDGEGVSLIQVNGSLPETLMAGADSTKATEGDLPSHAPPAHPPGLLASTRVNNGPSLRPEGPKAIPPSPDETADASRGEDSTLAGAGQPWEPPDRSPPKLQTPFAEDAAVPDRSPPDAVVTTTTGLEAEVVGSSERDEAVLKSLGYLDTQDSRASPPMASSVPAALPRGSPASDTTVLRSFGYDDWKYGRASPHGATLEGAARVNGSARQNTAVLNSIGYMDWQDGRALAVVDDGDEGVRLIHEGELLDDNRFEVIKVNPEAVEVAELPVTRPGLPGDPTFRPSSRIGTTGQASLPARLKVPTESMPAARLVPAEGQFSSSSDRPASVPSESTLALPDFAMRGQGATCFDLRSLLVAPSASSWSWGFSALNLYFVPGATPALAKAASATCAGALAF